MYYKIRNDILFRKYPGHGYITDNWEYGYHMLNDKRQRLGERFVSASGAVMLSVLDRSPKHIEKILDDLLKIFTGVDKETLKEDTVEFYDMFVKEGFLCYGDTFDSCIDYFMESIMESDEKVQTLDGSIVEKCAEGEIHSNEFFRSIHIDVANLCNERCIHCYIPEQCKKNVIDSDLFYRIIDEGRDMNIIHVTLSGGEPLLHGDILKFLEKCRVQNLSVNVLSNLTLLTEKIISEMKQNPLLSVFAVFNVSCCT